MAGFSFVSRLRAISRVSRFSRISRNTDIPPQDPFSWSRWVGHNSQRNSRNSRSDSRNASHDQICAKTYCPRRNDYNLHSWQIKNAIVSAISAKLIPLGILRCNRNQRVFPRNCYISRETIRLGIKNCNCDCNLQKNNSRKRLIVACNHFDDKGKPPRIPGEIPIARHPHKGVWLSPPSLRAFFENWGGPRTADCLWSLCNKQQVHHTMCPMLSAQMVLSDMPWSDISN